MKRKLSVREEQVLVLVCEGWTKREIAAMMEKSPNTIANHLKALRNKTGCSKATQLVIWAVAHRIVDPRKMLSG